MINLAHGMNDKPANNQQISLLEDFQVIKNLINKNESINIINNTEIPESNVLTISLNPKNKEYIADINIYLDTEPFELTKDYLDEKIAIIKKPLNRIIPELLISRPCKFSCSVLDSNLSAYIFESHLLEDLGSYIKKKLRVNKFKICTTGEFIISLLAYIGYHGSINFYNFTREEKYNVNSFNIPVKVDYSRQFDLAEKLNIEYECPNLMKERILIISNSSSFASYDELHSSNSIWRISQSDAAKNKLSDYDEITSIMFVGNNIKVHDIDKLIALNFDASLKNTLRVPTNYINYDFFIIPCIDRNYDKDKTLDKYMSYVKDNYQHIKNIPSRYNSHEVDGEFVIASNTLISMTNKRYFLSVRYMLDRILMRLYSYMVTFLRAK